MHGSMNVKDNDDHADGIYPTGNAT